MTYFFDLSLVLACLVIAFAFSLAVWFAYHWGYHHGAMNMINDVNATLRKDVARYTGHGE